MPEFNERIARAARYYFRGEMLAWGSLMCGGWAEDPPCYKVLYFDLDLDDLEADTFTRSMQPGPDWDVLPQEDGGYQLYCKDCIARKREGVNEQG